MPHLGFTDIEKAEIRRHLGYPNTSTQFVLAKGMINGSLASSWLLDAALNNMRPEAIFQIKAVLTILAGIETKITESLDRLAAIRLGELQLRTGRPGESEPDLLWKEYDRHAARLADLVGVAVYPYSTRGGGAARAVTRNIG